MQIDVLRVLIARSIVPVVKPTTAASQRKPNAVFFASSHRQITSVVLLISPGANMQCQSLRARYDLEGDILEHF